MTAPVPRLAFDRDHIRGHCEMIHRLAAPLAGRGKIVVASYGEDPTTGDAITPKVEHFKIGDVEAMTAAILQLCGEQYRNVYAPLAVFKNLPVGKKGTEADIVAVLGLVPDFDDANAARWHERLPLPASYVLETSAGRFQAFNLFDKPEPPAAVKPVAMRLKQFAGCDHGTADVCHVWRIPGTLNWPSKKKVEGGRSPEPQQVRIAQKLNGSVALAELAAALPETKVEAKANGHDWEVGERQEILLENLSGWVQDLITEGKSGKRKVKQRGPQFAKVISHLRREGYTQGQVLGLLSYYPDGVAGKYDGRLEKEIDRVWEKLDARSNKMSSPYEVVNGILCYWKLVEEAPFPVPLANFAARIEEDQIIDDGATEIRRYRIAGALANGTPLPIIEVPADKFSGIGWIDRYWGARPIVNVGAGAAMITTAIKEVSTDLASRRIYAHLGWRNIDSHWLYMHAGGAIGAEGPVDGYEVEPGGELVHYILPPVRRLPEAVRASLGMLDMGPAAAAAVCAVWRAPTAEFFPVTVSLFMTGSTGYFKSALLGCAQAHWGARWDGVLFPANWTGTANALERTAFVAKDALLVVDDFNPKGTQYEVAAMHATADRLLRAQGNLGGRVRMNPDTSLKEAYPPRGLIASSGEDLPRGQSLRARMVAIRIAKGDIDKAKLSALQAAARDGLLAEAMAAYIAFLARHADELPARLAARRDEIRAKQQAEHARTPDNLASLTIGLELFLDFAVDVGALSWEAAEVMQQRADAELRGLIEIQKEEQRAENPVEMFCDAARAMLASGRAHLRGDGGGEPPDPGTYGWLENLRTMTLDQGDGRSAENDSARWMAQGKHIGWTDGETLWLVPTVALAEVNTLLRANGRNIELDQQTLWKAMDQAGLVIERGKTSTTVPKWLEGSSTRVLCLAANKVLERQEPQKP